MKTSELIGPALDWAVAKCEGRDCYADKDGIWFRNSGSHPDGIETDYGGWTLCGPIIAREEIRWNKKNGQFYAWIGGHEWYDPLHEPMDDSPGVKWDGFAYGPTLLVAAMRAYVSSKLGDEVEIPEELL